MPLKGQPDNNRKLYYEFRQRLKDNESDIFYDENDLIEIYDQAADMEDEYVKLQALMLAYRLYPKSEEMAARRGYFFWSYNMDDGVDQILNSPLATERLIWKILSLRNRSITREGLENQLEQLLADETDIDDETMIQLVDLASEAGAFEWLKSHEGLLKKKTTYLPTLLYELQVVAAINGDREYAIRKLEELTENEPFNADYWAILSEEQMNAGNVDAAISAADYALAIDSDNEEAILARARAMACSESMDANELLRLVSPLLKPDSNDSRPLKIAVTAMLQSGQTDEATSALLEFNSRNPWDRDIIEYLLVIRYPRIKEILNNFYNANSDNSEDYWAKWALAKYDEGKFKEAAMILGCYSTHHPLSEPIIDIYASALYITGFYSAAASVMLNAIENDEHSISPSVGLAGVLSLLRLEQQQEAIKTIDKLLEMQSAGRLSISSTLRNSGYIMFLTKLRKLTTTNRRFNLDEIDPFVSLSDPELDY